MMKGKSSPVSVSRPTLLPTWASSAMVTIAFVALTALIWFLAEQNRVLKSAGTTPGRSTPVVSLDTGDRLAEVTLRSLAGNDRDLIAALNGGGVVVVFTTTCPYCEATIPVWDALADQLAERGWSFIPVSLHDPERTQAYLAQHRLDWSAWTPALPQDRSALNVKIVPTTAIVDGTGQVVALWRGSLEQGVLGEIHDALRPLRAVAEKPSSPKP